MISASAFVSKVIRILRMGVVVGVTNGFYDTDYETGETWFVPLSDHEFKMKNDGKVYCNGTSAMFPKPETDKDGWEVEPVNEYFLEDLYNDCAETMYVVVNDKKITIWTREKGWVESVKFLNAEALKEMYKSEEKPQLSLKMMCATALLDTVGSYALHDIKDCFDLEVQKFLSSKSWWIQW